MKKNNIWSVFYLIFTVATLFLLLAFYLHFENTKKKQYFELESNLQLVSQTLFYNIMEKETMLTATGKELLTMGTVAEQQKYLQKVLKEHSTLIGFGLLRKDGSFIATSANIKLPKNTNLLPSDFSSYYFKKTLQSDHSVLGKTVHFSGLDEWVIPLRKSIRDEHGNVIAVAAVGILNAKYKNSLDALELLKKYDISITKAKDDHGRYYSQYRSDFGDSSEKELYGNAIEQDVIKQIHKRIFQKYGFTLESEEVKQQILLFEAKDIFNTKQFMALKYDKQYKIWVLLKTDYAVFMEGILFTFFIYTVIYLLLIILLYWLFKRIAYSEEKSIKKLVFQAQHDELTKLPNRKYMYKNIKEWTAKNQKQFFVLYLDLDNFKNVNDTYGHTLGDEILKKVAKRLKLFFSQEAMVIRQGGDEFIVFLSNQYEKELDKTLQNLLATVSKVYIIGSNEFRIGMSLGVSVYPKDSENIDALLSFSDTAMYEAKKHKNYYAFFSEAMRHRSILKADIEQQLRGTFENDELYLVYQPQIKCDGTLCGVEALVRWENKTLGFVSPNIFIEVAEQTGLINKLGEFIIRTALQEIKQLHQETGIHFPLSLNISVVQFMENGFLEHLLLMISEEGFEKSLLTLEVTESLSISDLDKMIPLLVSIREEGIEISLDDFGTGYSSLSVLKTLPIGELKIDKSFIDNIVYDNREKALVESIIDIGKNFGMKTLAEGVESKEQFEILKELHCDTIQGYYFSKPLTLKLLAEYLKRI